MDNAQTQTVLSALIFSAAAHTTLTVHRTHEHTMPKPSTGTICSRQIQWKGGHKVQNPRAFDHINKIKYCILPALQWASSWIHRLTKQTPSHAFRDNCIQSLTATQQKTLAQWKEVQQSCQAATNTHSKMLRPYQPNALLVSTHPAKSSTIPAVSFLASNSSFSCTVTRFIVPKIITSPPTLTPSFGGFNSLNPSSKKKKD